MNRRPYPCLILALLAFGGLGWAASQPIYDEKADAREQIGAAIAGASRSGKNIVLVFGANWCPDCHALDAQMHKPELASIIQKNFLILNIDTGHGDKNLDVAQKYGVPVKHGIPALAVLDPHGKLLYAQDQGQFADARHMSYESIKAFFEHWKPKA